jgi:KipI family sensor histidine kinase inhibitor
MLLMRLRRAGRSGLLIECRDAEQVEAWRAELWRRRDAGELQVSEIVAGARTVLLDGVAPGTADLVANWPAPPPTVAGHGQFIEITATFDGEDLADVASRWDVPVSEAVDRLTAASLVVAFCGFAPGFAYLRGLPLDWAVPRLSTPRSRVPAGAIGLADAYVGIYPAASPGGWRLVGHTDQDLFDVRREPPALLSPGARVRFVPA